MSGGLEVHSHSFVSGKRSGGHYERNGKWHTGTFSHSHEGGDKPHGHKQTGPACYTIDKDEWARATGLRGGGRKTFTVKPSGEQMPIVELAPEQRTFEVIIGAPGPRKGEPGYHGEGPGLAPAVRMALAFGMNFTIRDAGNSGDGAPSKSRRARRIA